MGKQVNLYEAKTQLSQLVEAAHDGQTIIIAKSGKPMAKLVPLSHGSKPKPKVIFGLMKGEFIESADFDDPLPEDFLLTIEGSRP